MIRDNFGRSVLNLRISVTQHCNLRCPYCHHEGQESQTEDSLVEMTAAEIIRIVKIAIGLDVSKIKITGGEPLLRDDILDIIEGIAGLRGLQDLAMTTNGTLLAPIAKDLRARGLTRINISLPSLNGDIYRKITGGNLTDVVRGIRASVNAGLHPVKMNMLILAGVNETEISDMIQFAEENNALLQLIELEPINLSQTYYQQHHQSMDDIESELTSRASHIEVRHKMQNRRIYHLAHGKVEVIHPTENSEFCAHCTRLRVTSDGKLKPCLMVNENLVDILTLMRKGTTDEELSRLFMRTCRIREPYYKAQQLASEF